MTKRHWALCLKRKIKLIGIYFAVTKIKKKNSIRTITGLNNPNLETEALNGRVNVILMVNKYQPTNFTAKFVSLTKFLEERWQHSNPSATSPTCYSFRVQVTSKGLGVFSRGNPSQNTNPAFFITLLGSWYSKKMKSFRGFKNFEWKED